jgi:MoxR-like ATPase
MFLPIIASMADTAHTQPGAGPAADRPDAVASHPESVAEARGALARVGYLADEPAALVAFLAQRLGKPVLVEGPAGVGKTELAKAISRATGRSLVRLQCYEGLDEAKSLYEWNYRKQLLRIQATDGTGSGSAANPAAPGRGSRSKSPAAEATGQGS